MPQYDVKNVNGFSHGEQGSVVDLTFVKDSLVTHMLVYIIHWRVNEGCTYSDQQAIYVTIDKHFRTINPTLFRRVLVEYRIYYNGCS